MNKRMAVGVIVLVLGLVMLGLIATDVYTMAFDRESIEDKEFYSYEKGQAAEADLRYITDRIGTVKYKKRLFGIPISTLDASLYLIVDNGGYVIIEAAEGKEDFDRIVERTKEYINGSISEQTETVAFVGRAEEITDEQLAVAGEYFAGKGIADEVWQNSTSSYVLVQINKSFLIIQLCIAFGFIFIGIVLLIIARRYTFGRPVYVGEKPPEEEKAEEAADQEKEAVLGADGAVPPLENVVQKSTSV